MRANKDLKELSNGEMTTAVTLFFLFSIGEKTGNSPDNDIVNPIVRIDFKKMERRDSIMWKQRLKFRFSDRRDTFTKCQCHTRDNG